MDELCGYLANAISPSRKELGVRCDGRTGRGKCNMIEAYPRPLSGAQAKAPPSPRSRLREANVQARQPTEAGTQIKDFDSYAVCFALPPERQGEFNRRMRDDVDPIALKQAEAEGTRVVKELEQFEIA